MQYPSLGRQRDEVGLAVTRAGQRSTWMNLPHDSMGSILIKRPASKDSCSNQATWIHIAARIRTSSFCATRRALGAVEHWRRVHSWASIKDYDAIRFTQFLYCSARGYTYLGSVRAYASEVAEELTERLTAALRSA